MRLDERVTVYKTREEWLEGRRVGIGSSDTAAVLGVSKWKSAYQLWAEKAGLVPHDNEDSPILEWGRIVEEPIAKKYAQVTGRKVVRFGDFNTRTHPTLPFMFSSHDAVIESAPGKDGPGILSIKAPGIFTADEWMVDPEHDIAEAPLAYEVQMQQELATSGFRWGSFALLIWGKDLVWFDRNRHDMLVGEIESGCAAFWERVQTLDAPPIDSSKHTEQALKGRYRSIQGAETLLDDARLLDDLIAAELAEASAKTAKQLAKNRLIETMGEASLMKVPGRPDYFTMREVAEAEIPPKPASIRDAYKTFRHWPGKGAKRK